MASNLIAMASNLIAVASNPIAMASNWSFLWCVTQSARQRQRTWWKPGAGFRSIREGAGTSRFLFHMFMSGDWLWHKGGPEIMNSSKRTQKMRAIHSILPTLGDDTGKCNNSWLAGSFILWGCKFRVARGRQRQHESKRSAQLSYSIHVLCTILKTWIQKASSFLSSLKILDSVIQ